MTRERPVRKSSTRNVLRSLLCRSERKSHVSKLIREIAVCKFNVRYFLSRFLRIVMVSLRDDRAYNSYF